MQFNPFQQQKQKIENEIVTERWMVVINRYPNGESYPVKFFKVGSDYKKPTEKPQQQKLEIRESKEEIM